ncbi:MAG: hypothetical protein QW793_04720 [Candidatus Caldarchaeum sp.]
MMQLTRAFTAGGFAIRDGIAVHEGRVLAYECRSRHDAVPPKQIELMRVESAEPGQRTYTILDVGYCGGWKLAKPQRTEGRALASWALVYSTQIPLLLKPAATYPSGRVVYAKAPVTYVSPKPRTLVDARLFLVHPHTAFAMWARWAGTTKRESKLIPKQYWYSVHYWDGSTFTTVPLYEDKHAQRILDALQGERKGVLEAGTVFANRETPGFRRLNAVARWAQEKIAKALGWHWSELYVNENALKYVHALCAVCGYVVMP